MRAWMQDRTTSLGLLALRVGIGGYLATHGWGKLQMLLDGQAELLGDPIGIGNLPSLVLVMLAELACSILVVVGLGTRLAAIPPVIAMAVAAFVAHAHDPWSSETAAKAFFAGTSKVWFSKEPALTYLIPFLALAFTGAGRYSLDAFIGGRTREHPDRVGLPTGRSK